MIHIRPIRQEDIPNGTALCREAGWNQLDADWMRLIDLEPDGVFVAENDGTVCGSASALRYGTHLGWIGMILVKSEFRRQGIGNRLMKHCISYLEQEQVESIKLDATSQGRPVYMKLGFQDEQGASRKRPGADGYAA